MKVFLISKGSTGLDGLKLAERERPSPSAGQVLVRMRAASLNFRDLAIVAGKYFRGPVTQDTIPLSDGAGEVAAVGAGVTVWNALMHGPRVLKAGETVLALGTGGVSIFALQFAKALGARVVITSSSDEKLARARELGADDVVNYRTVPEWHEKVVELTGGRGADRVVEVGGAGTLPRSLKAAAFGGRVVVIGSVAGRGASDVGPADIFARTLTLEGIFVGSRDDLEAVSRAVAATGLRPVVDRVFGFDEAREAYRHLERGSHFGKIVVAMG